MSTIIYSILALRVCAMYHWYLVETDPEVTILDVGELLSNLLLGVTMPLYYLPECDEFIFRYLSISVEVDLIEEFFRGNLTKVGLPML